MASRLDLEALTAAQKRALITRALEKKASQRTSAAPPAEPRYVETPVSAPGARVRLVCVPPLAAGGKFFADWAEALAPEIEVRLVTYPGRGHLMDQAPFADLETATTGLLRALRDTIDRPYALYGHSMGGSMAFHLATQLACAGAPPERVFISAATAPEGRDAFPDVSRLTDDELFQLFWGAPRGNTPEGVHRELLLACARADTQLSLALRAALKAQALDLPVTVIGSRSDPLVPIDAMLAWARHCTGDFELQVMNGEHHFVRTASGPVHRLFRERLLGAAPKSSAAPGSKSRLGLGLFFFSCNEADYAAHRYRLVEDSVQLADRSGFEAVWIPERHFHPVGGLFPNPSVLAAALAVRTQSIRLRSGSVVLPLHDPIRVAEEWSVVDNLSNGRVELSFVPGWNPNDYVLAPEAYANRWAVMLQKADTVQRLWRGETVSRPNGLATEASVRIHPSPCQRELPVWVTTSSRDETFVRAGELGLNVLTALLTQSVDDLARRIDVYRRARERSGLDPRTGRVALMLHSYVGESEEEVRSTVREPFLDYMRSVKNLWEDNVQDLRVSGESETRMLDMVFERYFHRATLFGTVQECARRAERFIEVGVDELACAIDFGVPYEKTMASVQRMVKLRQQLSVAVEEAP